MAERGEAGDEEKTAGDTFAPCTGLGVIHLEWSSRTS